MLRWILPRTSVVNQAHEMMGHRCDFLNGDKLIDCPITHYRCGVHLEIEESCPPRTLLKETFINLRHAAFIGYSSSILSNISFGGCYGCPTSEVMLTVAVRPAPDRHHSGG